MISTDLDRIKAILNKLTLQNYRGFEGGFTIDFDENLTVFIGNNGSGKTTILDAIHQSYSYLIGKIIPRLKFDPSIITSSDVNNNQNEAEIVLDMSLNNEPSSWKIDFGKKIVAYVNEIEESDKNDESIDIIDQIDIAFKKKAITNLPIYKFVRSDVSFRQDNTKIQTDLTAIYDDYHKSHLDFIKAKEWFKWQQNKNSNGKVFLEVKNALYQMLSDDDNLQDFSNLYVDWETPEGIFTIEKGKTKIFESQLSSGEKRIFALVSEIAMLLCLANPASETPLLGNGIVLIDEIELHLHPKWQQKVVTKLRDIFPNVQFIITTHSPLIINNTHKNNIRIIKDGHIKSLDYYLKGFNNYGADIQTTLNLIMGLDSVYPKEVQNLFNEYFRLIDSDLVKAKAKREELEKIVDVEHSELLKGQSLIELKELFQ